MKNAVGILPVLLTLSLLSCQTNGFEEAKISFERGQAMVLAGKPDSALLHYRNAIEAIKDFPDDALTGELYNRVGDLLVSADIYESACEAYRNAYFHTGKLSDKTGAARSLRGMGKSFIFRRQWDSATVYLSKAEALLPQVKDSNEVSRVYDNLSAFYLMQNEFGKSLSYNQKAINTVTDSSHLYRNWLAKAIILKETGQYDSARYYSKLSSRSNNIYTQAGSYLKLWQLCRLTTDADSTNYLHQYHLLKDSIERMNLQNPVMSVEDQYILDRFIKKEKQKGIQLFIVIVIFCAVLFFFMMIRHKNLFLLYKKERETITQLQERMSKVQNELTRAQEKEIQLEEQCRINDKLKEVHASITSNMKKSATFWKEYFLKSKLYRKIKEKVENPGATPAKEELDNIQEEVLIAFKPFVGYLSAFLNMPADDCYLCCLSLGGFTTKECSVLRNVTADAIRSQRTRIKKRFVETFTDAGLYSFIFTFEPVNADCKVNKY